MNSPKITARNILAIAWLAGILATALGCAFVEARPPGASTAAPATIVPTAAPTATPAPTPTRDPIRSAKIIISRAKMRDYIAEVEPPSEYQQSVLERVLADLRAELEHPIPDNIIYMQGEWGEQSKIGIQDINAWFIYNDNPSGIGPTEHLIVIHKNQHGAEAYESWKHEICHVVATKCRLSQGKTITSFGGHNNITWKKCMMIGQIHPSQRFDLSTPTPSDCDPNDYRSCR